MSLLTSQLGCLSLREVAGLFDNRGDCRVFFHNTFYQNSSDLSENPSIHTIPEFGSTTAASSMKMPNNQSSENGLYDYEDTTYISESIDNNGVEEFNATPDDDFSEYLWMENEEEFDKEVMQRLEEEALMEECIEAMLADENSEAPSNHTNGADPSNEVSNMINNLKLDCPEVVKESNLNPLAAEFIPGGSHTPVETVTGSS